MYNKFNFKVCYKIFAIRSEIEFWSDYARHLFRPFWLLSTNRIGLTIICRVLYEIFRLLVRCPAGRQLNKPQSTSAWFGNFPRPFSWSKERIVEGVRALCVGRQYAIWEWIFIKWCILFLKLCFVKVTHSGQVWQVVQFVNQYCSEEKIHVQINIRELGRVSNFN